MRAHPRRPPLMRASRLLLAVAAAAAARRPKTSARCAFKKTTIALNKSTQSQHLWE